MVLIGGIIYSLLYTKVRTLEDAKTMGSKYEDPQDRIKRAMENIH